ncbi:MAG: tetratricopeptide repeat protein [Casimicrobiaceae bacterium]
MTMRYLFSHLVLLGFMFAAAGFVHAAPYKPVADDVVLERLPERTDPSLAELKRLRRALAQRPNDTTIAMRVAQRSIEAARESGDPRRLGQAQAALAPWWGAADAPLPIVVLRATIKQSLHDFDAALADLALVLKKEPGNAQARLTRASVLTVIGRYADASADCAALARVAPPLVVTACNAQPRSVNGEASDAYAALAAALQRPDNSTAIVEWALTLAAEIAARRGDHVAAENHFRRALALDPRDAYLLAAYADFLLDRGRPREAAAVATTAIANDNLLLRVAIAEARLADPTPDEQRRAETHRADLAARFAALRARGDIVHRREEAMYALHLERDARRALDLARANWQVQKEPADLRILAEAARAARDRASVDVVEAWIRQHRLEDAALAAVMGAA